MQNFCTKVLIFYLWSSRIVLVLEAIVLSRQTFLHKFLKRVVLIWMASQKIGRLLKPSTINLMFQQKVICAMFARTTQVVSCFPCFFVRFLSWIALKLSCLFVGNRVHNAFLAALVSLQLSFSFELMLLLKMMQRTLLEFGMNTLQKPSQRLL